MKRLAKTIGTLVCAFVAGTSVAPAQVTVTTADGNGADTYLSNDSQGGQDATSTHGLDTGFQHRIFEGVRMKMLYVRFNKPTNLINFSGSTIAVNFTGANRSRICTVYGLNDGDPGETWDEGTTSYSNAPGIVYTTNTPVAAFPTVDTNRMTTLGTWQWQATTGVQTSDSATLNLAPFLEADTDGFVTFLFLTTSDNSQSYFGTCKEDTNAVPPTLNMPFAVVDPGFPNLSWRVGDGVWDIDTTPNWFNGTGSAVYQELGGVVGSRVMLDDTASGSSPITISLDITVSPRSVTNSATKDYIVSGSGAIAGGTGITVEGSGTLTLDTINSFLGAVNVNSGTLALGVNGSGLSLGSASAVNMNGGVVAWPEGAFEDISYNSAADTARAVNFNADATFEVMDTTGSYPITFSSTIGSGGPGALIKTGPGTLTLAFENAYMGNTLVNAGTLAVDGADALTNSPAIVLGGGDATIDSRGLFVTLNPDNNQVLAGSGTVAAYLTATNNTVITPGTNGVAGTLTFGRPLFGDGSLTVSGGKVVLDVSTNGPNDLIRVNSYLTFDGGTIELIVGGTLTNGTYTLMEYDSASGYTVSGLGTMAVTGFSQAGQVAFLSDGTPGKVDLIVAPLSDKSLVWRGTDPSWDVDITQSWLDGASPSVFNQGDSVTFNDSGSGLAASLQSLLFPSAIVVDASVDYSFEDGTGTGGAKISGKAALTKSGSGTLTVNTPNNNSGGTTVNGGKLVVGGHIGDGPVLNNGQLEFSQSIDHKVGAVTGTGSLTQQGSATLTIASAGYSGPTTISSGTLQIGNGGPLGGLSTSGITDNGILALNTSDDLSLPAIVSGSGGLTKRGSGTLTLPAPYYSGATTVDTDGGKIVAGAENVVAGTLTVEANGVFDMNGFDQSPQGLISTTFAGGTVTNSAATTNTLTVTANTASDATVTLEGPIQLVKLGTNELIMRADASTYTGGTIVGEGTLQGRGGNGSGFFGTGPITLSNNVTFQFDNFPGNELRVVSGATATLLARALGDGYGGPIVSGDDASTLIIGNGISLGINNTQQLQGFTGTVLVSTNAGAEIRFSSTSLTINGGELAKFELQGPGLIHTRNGTSEDEGAGVFMGSLTGDATARLEGATSQNRVTRYVIGGNNLSTEYAGIVGLEAGGGNPVAIMKVGTGTLTLSGTNLYEAATTVNDGTLAFTGAGANPTNTSSVTVLSPGVLDVSGLTDGTLYLGNPNGLTLGGDGSIMGSLVVDAAVSTVSVTPGASIGTLTVTNSLTLTANTAITMEVATGNSSDQIAANTLTLGGASITVTNIGGSSLKAGDTFQLFNQPVGDAGTVNLPPEDAYGTYTWNNNLNSDGSVVVATAIPKIDTNPTNITYSVSGGEITITWPESHTGWTLQSQTNALNVGISTNWTDLGYENTNSATLPIDPANPTVFYRITLP